MKYGIYVLLVWTAFACCQKSGRTSGDGPRVDIYLLKSFSVRVDTTVYPAIHTIVDAALEESPLISDSDIRFYRRSEAVFTLSKNIKQIILHYGGDKSFAVTVDKEPVYYGKFHPAYYSSILFGLPTIDPIMDTDDYSIRIRYAGMSGSALLPQLDKRNDARIISALEASGRLR